MKKSEEIKFRVTPEEKKHFRKLAGTGTIAGLFRGLLNAEKMKPQRVIKAVDPRLIYQLHKIGVNLNQIAKGINTANTLGTNVDVVKVTALLMQIHLKMKELYDAAQNSNGDDS